MLGSYYEANCQGASVVHLRRIIPGGLVPDELLHKRHVRLDDVCTESAEMIQMS